MKQLFTFKSHPSEDVLEEYAFERLDEDQTAAIEEHLLLCEPCREILTTIDHLCILKTETANVSLSPNQGRFKEFWRYVWSPPRAPRLAWAMAGALACLLLVLYVSRSVKPDGPAVPVALISLRGTQDRNTGHAPGGKPLDLQIAAASLPMSESYRVEVVNTLGKSVWEGKPNPSDRTLHASIPPGLPTGFYWVRLYNSQELITEYALRVD